MRNSLLIALAPLLIAAPALAQSYAPGGKPSADEEPAYVEAPAPSRGGYAPRGNDHTGMMGRLSLGIGAGSVAEDWSGTSLTSSGGAMLYSFALGGAVSPNLSLGADLFGFGLSEPKVDYAGTSYGNQKNTRLNVNGLGFNATYYFMPTNLYLSGTAGLVRITREKFNSSGSSQSVSSEGNSSGLGVSLMVGKEWMVSREWGIGVAGQFIAASTSKSESGIDVAVGSAAFGVSFTATYF